MKNPKTLPLLHRSRQGTRPCISDACWVAWHTARSLPPAAASGASRPVAVWRRRAAALRGLRLFRARLSPAAALSAR